MTLDFLLAIFLGLFIKPTRRPEGPMLVHLCDQRGQASLLSGSAVDVINRRGKNSTMGAVRCSMQQLICRISHQNRFLDLSFSSYRFYVSVEFDDALDVCPARLIDAYLAPRPQVRAPIRTVRASGLLWLQVSDQAFTHRWPRRFL